MADPPSRVWRNPDMVIRALPGAGLVPDRHGRVAADVGGVHPHEARFVDLIVGNARQDLLERDPTLEPCERRTEAHVDAVAERERLRGPAADVELVGTR